MGQRGGRHKAAMQELEKEMQVEMARQREELNRELEEELQKELEVRGKRGNEREEGGRGETGE